MPSSNALLLERGVDRQGESHMMLAFKELGYLCQEHMLWVRRESPASGSSGELGVYGLGGEKEI